MKNKCKVILWCLGFVCLLAGCSSDMASKQSENSFILTEQGKAFLEKMCLYTPDFQDYDSMDTQFWKDFIFYSFTGMREENVEQITRLRENYGYETVAKVSLTYMQEYAKLAFGTELPDIKPKFEDMNEGATAFYYEDGYYYIGDSDYPDFRYSYKHCTTYEDENGTYAIAEYQISFEDEEDFGKISFRLQPVDNENGFIILSKSTEVTEHLDEIAS